MKITQAPQYAAKESILILKNGTRLISAVIYDIHDENRQMITLGSPTKLTYDEGSTIPTLKAFEFESDDDLCRLPVDHIDKVCEPWESIAHQYAIFLRSTHRYNTEATNLIFSENESHRTIKNHSISHRQGNRYEY